jgi:sporulation protein YlmC with PRC-barrel domain
MTDSEKPIAWTALSTGTSVFANDGSEIGKVSTVVADENKDIFSGIAVRSGLFDSEQFVPADLIERITADEVHVGLSADEAGKLEPYTS